MKREIVSPIKFINDFSSDSVLKAPGDKVETYITPKGNEQVMRVNTAELNVTFRQYLNKDGQPGKKTITFKEVRR